MDKPNAGATNASNAAYAASAATAATAAFSARREAHWKATQRLTAALLLIWLLTGFLTVFFARELLHLNLFGWPLPFYMAAQGASLVYLAIIGFYAWRMRRMDRAFQRATLAEQP